MLLNEKNLLYLIIILQSILIVWQRYNTIDNSVSQPVFFTVKLDRKGDNMALVYGLTCGKPVDSDVVERRLAVQVNGTVVDNKVFAGDVVDFGELSFTQDDSIVLTLVDVDDAGNVSKPSLLEFVATDTLPPATPGGFSVSLVRET